jgi:hypothetical protein
MSQVLYRARLSHVVIATAAFWISIAAMLVVVLS